MEEHIEPAGWALGLSGVALLVGAWISYRTGDHVHGIRTHMDAALVLLCLGLVLIANGLGAIAYGRDAVRRRERAARTARWNAERAAGTAAEAPRRDTGR